ncbi:hypothetical protein LCGC14_2913630, partial [marine sediment metagenome]
MKQFNYLVPRSLDEAISFHEAHGERAKYIAGGTDVLVKIKAGKILPDYLISLKHILGQDRPLLNQETGELYIGSFVTHRMIEKSAIVRIHYPILHDAIRNIGSVQIRNVATIGGNLCQDSCCVYFNRPEEVRQSLPPCHKLGGNTCHVVPSSADCWAPYTGDLAPVLMALGGTVTVAGRNGEKARPIAEIFTGDGSR